MAQSMTVLFDELCELAAAVREGKADWHSTIYKAIYFARDIRFSLTSIASSLEEISSTLREMKAK